MNPLPPNADELVSAYLDGEAAPDEVAIVESSPELMARVESMRAVSQGVGAPLTAPSAQKEAHIGAALDAFDALFAGTDTNSEVAAADTADTPPLAAVPDLAAATAASPSETAPVAAPPSDSVASLETARARRNQKRGRRFNTGVIAAAAAALLLFVGLAALSFRGTDSDSVASTALDAAEAPVEDRAFDDATDTSSVAVEADMGDEEAIEEEPAMEAMADEDAGGLSSAAPQPTPVAQATASPAPATDAGDSDDAMNDEAMSDEAGGVDQDADDAASDQTTEVAEAEAAPPDPSALETQRFSTFDLYEIDYFLGDFATIDDLGAELLEFDPPDLDLRADIGSELPFPRCQNSIPELAESREPTLIGGATVEGVDVEVHRLLGARNTQSFVIADPSDCSVVATLP